ACRGIARSSGIASRIEARLRYTSAWANVLLLALPNRRAGVPPASKRPGRSTFDDIAKGKIRAAGAGGAGEGAAGDLADDLRDLEGAGDPQKVPRADPARAQARRHRD